MLRWMYHQLYHQWQFCSVQFVNSIFCSYHGMVDGCGGPFLEGTTFEALAKVETKSKRKSSMLIQTREDHARHDVPRLEKNM